MIYLSRLDTEEVNLKEFEQYCAIKCKGRAIPNDDSILSENLTEDE